MFNIKKSRLALLKIFHLAWSLISGRIRDFDRDISVLFLFLSVRLSLSIFSILQGSILKNTFLLLRLTAVHVSKTLSTPFVGPLSFPLRRLCSISS